MTAPWLLSRFGIVAVVLLGSAPFMAVGTHVDGCVPTSADPATLIPIDAGGNIYYIEERDAAVSNITPIPGSGVTGSGSWIYQESNAISGTLQRGGVGATGACMPPVGEHCVLVGEDPINDETCTHGPDTIIAGGGPTCDAAGVATSSPIPPSSSPPKDSVQPFVLVDNFALYAEPERASAVIPPCQGFPIRPGEFKSYQVNVNAQGGRIEVHFSKRDPETGKDLAFGLHSLGAGEVPPDADKIYVDLVKVEGPNGVNTNTHATGTLALKR